MVLNNTLFSDELRRLISSYSKTYACPEEFIVAGIYQSVAFALGKKIKLDDGKYTNYPMLWMGIVAPSGTNKSEPINRLLAPLRGIDSYNYQLYKDEMKSWRNGGQEGQKPICNQILAADTTPEARNQLLATNSNGIGIYRDELAGMIQDFGRYNKSGEMAQMLSIFDSNDIIISRKNDDPLLITRPYMGILGTIQPEILAKVFSNSSFTDSGFIQRWLWIWNDEYEIADYINSTIPTHITTQWENYINQLMRIDSKTIRLDDEAHTAYETYYNLCQADKRNASAYEATILSKLQIHVLRWAIISELLMHFPRVEIKEISMKAMTIADMAMGYFRHTAEKVNDIIHSHVTNGMRIGRQELIYLVYKEFSGMAPVSQSVLSDALNITPQAVHNAIKKYEKKFEI